MSNQHIAICGAGIAGIATAYYLSTRHDCRRITLIDRNQPMSLTTSKSGENFRDYWPQPCMTALVRHSLDLMNGLAEETGNVFEMRYSGYDFVSESLGRRIFPTEHLDGGPGADLIRVTGAEEILASNPCLGPSVRQLVRISRAGAFDVYALGSLLLSRARRAGVELVRGTIEAIDKCSPGFSLDLSTRAGQRRLDADTLVLTPGPFINQLMAMLELEPLTESVLQRKFVIPDPLGIIPRDMPFTIFADRQFLHWHDEERALIEGDPEFHWLLSEFPAGLHVKPEGNHKIKLGWAFNRQPEEPRWETANDFDFPNITLRGASGFIPALKQYVDELPTPVVQFSGYYTRTPENLPLIGPLELPGVYTVSALAGFGTMAACSAGALCADWMMGSKLPEYAEYFSPRRYRDARLMSEINRIPSDGQL